MTELKELREFILEVNPGLIEIFSPNFHAGEYYFWYYYYFVIVQTWRTIYFIPELGTN